MRNIIILVAVCCVFGSCATYKSYKSPGVDMTGIYGEGIVVADSATDVPNWQTMFPDTTLQSLIRRGLEYNTDLQTARLNIEQAEATLQTSKLAYLPSLAVAPTGGVNSFDNSKASYSYTLPVTMQWEIDISGKLRNTKQQALAAVEQNREYKLMVQTQLVSSIANGYYTLVMLNKQLDITQKCVENLKSNLEVIIVLKEAGTQTEAAVNQAAANYYAVQTTEKDLKKQIRNAENSIALLINHPSQVIECAPLEMVERCNVNLQNHISLENLSNRSDVKSAEYALNRSFYGVNVARSAFYPSLGLSGSAGWTNNVGDVVTNPAKLLLSALGSLTQPIFNKGVNRANLKIAKVNYEKTLLSFQQTLLNAGIEVNNALAQCQNSSDKINLRKMQVEANIKAVENSLELMKNSSMTYLEVLVAQNTLLQAQLSQVTDWFENMQGSVNLYKALGGGVE